MTLLQQVRDMGNLSTPADLALGRIMNRFAKDFEVLDSSLSSSIRQVGVQAVVFVASVLAVAAAWPGFFVLGPIIGYMVRVP
jgi:hypothetical protein